MAELIFCAVIFLVTLYGLIGRSNIRTGHFRRSMFVYYTNLSNLAVLLYMLLLCITWFLPESRLYTYLRLADAQFTITMCILITCLIFHFILMPEIRKRGTADGLFFLGRADNICVHYLVPLLTLVEWFTLADKSGLTLLSALYWLIGPLAYLLFTLIRAVLCGNIRETGHRYPYLFISPEALGIKKYLRNIAVLLPVFFLLGCIIVGLGKLVMHLFS